MFKGHGVPKFAFVYHAGHPVTRCNDQVISADYIGVIREELRQNFGNIPVIFLQGCGADIRPNIVRKRSPYFPELWLNKKFKAPPSEEEQCHVDRAYKKAVRDLCLEDEFIFNEKEIKISRKLLALKGQNCITYPVVSVPNKLQFHFLPFELSHFFHLNIQKKNNSCFLVSCTQNTYGYLPHPNQLEYGGYEVDSSRDYMGLRIRQELLESEFLI